MNKKTGIVAFSLLFLIFALLGKAYCSASEEFHKTITVAADTEVTVKNVNGNIEIISWDQNYIDVFAVKKTKKGQDELDKVTIDMNTNGVLEIEAVFHKVKRNNDSFFGRLFGSMNVSTPRVSVDFTIKLPQSVLLTDTGTTNGNITIEGTRGDTDIHSTNGNIVIDAASGLLNAKSTNGNIKVTGMSHIQSARTTNGNITLSLAEAQGEDTIVSTTNGSITVELSPDTNAELDMKTVNGKVYAQGFQIMVDSISKNHISGRLGSGGRSLSLHTVNGSITLNK